MKPILILIFVTFVFIINAQSRDPRSKDQANVFWDGKYPLYSLVSDKQISPDQNGNYNYWSATNEDPTPVYKTSKKGNIQYVYKFIDYSECYYWCVDYRKATGKPSIEPTRMIQSRNENANSNVTQQDCNFKFAKPTGLTYSFIDNRKICCYCEKNYSKYTVNDDYTITGECEYLSKKLLYHLKTSNSNENHKKADIANFDKFLTDNYGWVYQITYSAFVETYSKNGLYFSEIPTNIKVDKYNIKSKFCSNECESKCNYYGCKSCN